MPRLSTGGSTSESPSKTLMKKEVESPGCTILVFGFGPSSERVVNCTLTVEASHGGDALSFAPSTGSEMSHRSHLTPKGPGKGTVPRIWEERDPEPRFPSKVQNPPVTWKKPPSTAAPQFPLL